MSSKFDHALAVILTHEGGFVDHPQDPGGATNYGITQRTYNAWRRSKRLSVRSVKLIDPSEVATIYRTNYWEPLRCESFPFAIALSLFDFGVNAGISRAAKMLQKVAGALQDGVIGPKTIASVLAIHKFEFSEQYAAERILYYTSLNTFKHFGKGWTRRTIETLAISLLSRENMD